MDKCEYDYLLFFVRRSAEMTIMTNLAAMLADMQRQMQAFVAQMTHHDVLINGPNTRAAQRDAQRESRGIDDPDDDLMPNDRKDLDEREFRSCPVFRAKRRKGTTGRTFFHVRTQSPGCPAQR